MTDTYAQRDGHIRRMAAEWSYQHVAHCICRGAGYVRTNAPMSHPLFGTPIPCICRRDKAAAERAARLRRMCRLSDTELSQWSLERFDPALCQPGRGQSKQAVAKHMASAKDRCARYATKPEGWLILRGDTGTGKTHLAFGIVVEALRRDVPAMGSTVVDLLDHLREGFQQGNYDEMFWQVRDVRLLVLDDLGAHRMTDWATDALYQLVNHRYARRLPLVITTNADLATCGLDERIVSRVMEGAGVEGGWSRVVTLRCADFRPGRRQP